MKEKEGEGKVDRKAQGAYRPRGVGGGRVQAAGEVQRRGVGGRQDCLLDTPPVREHDPVVLPLLLLGLLVEVGDQLGAE